MGPTVGVSKCIPWCHAAGEAWRGDRIQANRYKVLRCSSPARLAASMTASPTAPSPNTATVVPGWTFAVLYTAPHPVDTPHPSRHTWTVAKGGQQIVSRWWGRHHHLSKQKGIEAMEHEVCQNIFYRYPCVPLLEGSYPASPRWRGSYVGSSLVKSYMSHTVHMVGPSPVEQLENSSRFSNYQLPITKWPHQSEAPVGAAPPTRSQLRLQRQS
jgi:hypothetical protein